MEAHPFPALEGAYAALLQSLSTLPQECAYRTATEALTRSRLELVNKHAASQDVAGLESAIGAGQVEELIGQATGEMSLVQKMKELRAWEDLEEPAPEGFWKTPGAL